MKNFLLFNLLFLFSTTCLAQSQKSAVIYLKNGSIIHGTIINQMPDSIVKIETKDSNVFVYKYSEIEKINSVSPHLNHPSSNVNVDTIKWSGFFDRTQTQYGYNTSNTDKGYSFIGLQTILGYQHNKSYSIGGGMGINNLTDWHEYDGIVLVSMFLNGRVNLSNSPKVRIYIDCSLGYNFGLNIRNNEYSIYGETGSGYGQMAEVSTNSSVGGLLINPQIGCSFPISKKSTFDIGVGFFTLPITINTSIDNVNSFQGASNYTGTDNLNFIQLKVGFTFLK